MFILLIISNYVGIEYLFVQGFLDTDVISEYFKLYSPINATVQVQYNCSDINVQVQYNFLVKVQIITVEIQYDFKCIDQVHLTSLDTVQLYKYSQLYTYSRYKFTGTVQIERYSSTVSVHRYSKIVQVYSTHERYTVQMYNTGTLNIFRNS